MNRFQAMARIMAILCEGSRLSNGSEKYKIARKLVATRIERLGPDAAYSNAKWFKRELIDQIEELHRLRGLERF
jgi:hypothetical protein